MILGVNDISQIGNEALAENIDLQNSMIKENMNDGIGQNKVALARNIIKNSRFLLNNNERKTVKGSLF